MPPDSAKVATLEGVRPVLEAVRAGRRRVLEVQLPEAVRSRGVGDLWALLRSRGIPHRAGPAAQGVLASVEPFPEEAFEDLLLAPPPRRLVALDRVTDVGNLGSIARTAEAAGVAGLVLEHRHAPAIGRGAFRASAGALEHLRVGRTPNLRRALELARQEGLAVWAATPGGAPLAHLDPVSAAGEWVLVLGSEERGVRPSILEQADARLGVPMVGRVASLGVAAAAAYLILRLAERATEAPVDPEGLPTSPC